MISLNVLTQNKNTTIFTMIYREYLYAGETVSTKRYILNGKKTNKKNMSLYIV